MELKSAHGKVWMLAYEKAWTMELPMELTSARKKAQLEGVPIEDGDGGDDGCGDDLRLKEMKGGKSRALSTFSEAERGKSRARDAVSVLANLLISCRC